jgi:hypothetical protein
MLPAGLNIVKRVFKCPVKKTQPSCPGSRDLNWTGKGLRFVSDENHDFLWEGVENCVKTTKYCPAIPRFSSLTELQSKSGGKSGCCFNCHTLK